MPLTNLHLEANLQSLSPAPQVELFSLDTTPLSAVNGVTVPGNVYNWTPGDIGTAPIVFGGVTFTPLPIEFVDMKTTGQGTAPAPVIRISSLGGLIGSILATFEVLAGTSISGSLAGANVTRIRTFQDCIDGAVNADPSAFIGPDVFSIDRKSHQDKTYVEFTLAVSFDQQGRTFPGRQVIADSCQRTYRYYNGTTFVYGTCPYTGGNYFDTSGNAQTNPALDFCSKKLNTGCLRRFPGAAQVPTYAFPGASLTGLV